MVLQLQKLLRFVCFARLLLHLVLSHVSATILSSMYGIVFPKTYSKFFQAAVNTYASGVKLHENFVNPCEKPKALNPKTLNPTKCQK